MESVFKKLSDLGPLLFGWGFVAPLIAQSLDAASIEAPWSLSSLAFGMLVGTLLGSLATWRGRWV